MQRGLCRLDYISIAVGGTQATSTGKIVCFVRFLHVKPQVLLRWMNGSSDLCRGILARIPIILFSAEYRLAPEHVYPAAAEDCFAAYEWMCTNASKYNGDAGKAFIMGGSAGGNLSGAVALKYSSQTEPTRDGKEIPKPKGVLISCPCVIHPRALPREYSGKEWWNPDRYADSAMLSRDVVNQACGEWRRVIRGSRKKR